MNVMNIDLIKDRLEAFVIAETLLDNYAYVRNIENVYYLYSDYEVIFKMYVLSCLLVFFVDFSYKEAKEFERLILEFSHIKDGKVTYKVEKKFSFQFQVSDQKIAVELLEMILNFKGAGEYEHK